jgi:tRNA-dihydrouridine synthase A
MQLRFVDGVMLGRAAYEQPYILSEVDRRFFASAAPISCRETILHAEYLPYVEAELAIGTPLSRITRHLLGLFHGCYGGRLYRRVLMEEGHKPGATAEVLHRALAATRPPSALVAAE